MLKWILGILIVLAIGAAAAWWWLNRPLVLRHPDFGADCSSLVSTAELDRRIDCVRVWYGSNRRLVLAQNVSGASATDVEAGLGESDDTLHLGRADVWLPKLIEDGGSRARGETPHVQGALPRDASKLADYVFLTRITKTEREQFSTTLQTAVDQDRDRSVLLFIHGFNVGFDDALVRAAQLSHDLSRNRAYSVGAPVLFSWPSAGRVSLSDYQGDRDRSLAAAPHLENFLDLLTTDLELQRINIIAHSMGNRVLTQALEDYARDYLERHNRDDLEFRILLVAADVERDIFDEANGVFDNLDANVTIYTSDTDRALHVSNLVNTNEEKRLGDTDTNRPYIRASQNYETIDATAVTTELFGIGHNYYSDNPTILWDMMCTIGETDPQDRALELARFGDLPNGDPYYRINSDIRPNVSACTLHRSAFPAGGEVSDRASDSRSLDVMPDEAPPPAPPEPIEVMPESLDPQSGAPRTIFYVADLADLDLQPYEAVLQSVLDSDQELASLTILAHGDTVGSLRLNGAQTQAFADAIKAWYVERGVFPGLITAIGAGETELAIETADEVDEALNRRVELIVEYSN